MKSSPILVKISIITVGMNHLQYLKPLLHSLYYAHPPTTIFEMIYVDNCSQDSSADYIEKNYPQVKVVRNEKPMGFGENNNLGAQYAIGEYIAIINPDIVFLENSLDQLVSFAQNLTKDAIIAPQLLNPDRSIQWSVRGFMNPITFVMRTLTRGRDDTSNSVVRKYLRRDIKSDQVQTIDWAIGAALVMTKKLYDELHGFDTDYFLYFEDVDLCVRAWKKKHQVIYYPKAQLIHNHLRGSTELSGKTLMHLKSMFVFFKKHGFFLGSFREKHPL